MQTRDEDDDRCDLPCAEDFAAEAFLRKASGDGWTAQDESDLQAWLAKPEHRAAYSRVVEAWQALGQQACSPEIQHFRRDAVGRLESRQDSARRSRFRLSGIKWAIAASVTLFAGLAIGLLLERPDEAHYQTGIAEQLIVELEDHSRIALDARSALSVRFTRDSRVITLSRGQAHFVVARDPRRPFRVDAGDNTITAVGTSFNVEHFENGMQVAIIEGRVFVNVGLGGSRTGPGTQGAGDAEERPRDLVAGQALRIDQQGKVVVLDHANIEAALAWRQGRIVLDDTSLAEAIDRFNRYSRQQILIEGAEIGALRVSGVFESGDMRTFIEAVEASLPVKSVEDGSGVIRLRPA